VEATKFTEVGFVGKDVDQIIRDLVDVALALEKTKALEEIKDKVASKVEERILDCLVGTTNIQVGATPTPNPNPNPNPNQAPYPSRWP
jgi:ATP-dependent HslUV protease ATP-binding subunit HslU